MSNKLLYNYVVSNKNLVKFFVLKKIPAISDRLKFRLCYFMNFAVSNALVISPQTYGIMYSPIKLFIITMSPSSAM